jgi:hypothetical protein
MSTESTSVAPPAQSKPVHEVRSVKNKNGVSNFNVLVVDTAEKWLPANAIHAAYNMPITGSNRSMRFNLYGVSLQDWEEAEINFPVPQRLEDENANDAAKQARLTAVDAAVIRKRCFLFEKALQQQIPGKDIDEKVAYLSQRTTGEIEALHRFIEGSLANFTDGELLQTFHSMTMAANEDNEVITFTGFGDWQVASETKYIFRMHRATEQHLVEFPLKGISEEVRKDIDLQCKDPEPPRIPRKDPTTGRFDPSVLVPNYEDYTWKKSVRAINQMRIVRLLSACLPFEIPGGNNQEQYKWLAQRAVGDVIRIRNFINNEILGVGARYDFFTKSFAQ